MMISINVIIQRSEISSVNVKEGVYQIITWTIWTTILDSDTHIIQSLWWKSILIILTIVYRHRFMKFPQIILFIKLFSRLKNYIIILNYIYTYMFILYMYVCSMIFFIFINFIYHNLMYVYTPYHECVNNLVWIVFLLKEISVDNMS